MTHTLKHIAAAALALAAVVTATAPASANPADETRKTIRAQLGFMPSFLAEVPDEAIETSWAFLGGLEMNPKTALSGAVKELIVVAVASQVPCKYCIYAGTKLAYQQGATEAQVKEAILMASLTRHWSTFLNGLGYSLPTFRNEIDRALAFASKNHEPRVGPIASAADAYANVKATFGFVPGFIRRYPKEAVAPMWRQLVDVQLSPKTSIDCKYKELIGLAVASQIPCSYCVYSHTKTARLLGATEREISEAVAMASAVRYWSTFFNGAQIDEATFRKEIDRLTRPHKTARKAARKAHR